MGDRQKQDPIDDFLARLRAAIGARDGSQDTPDSSAPYESERQSFVYDDRLAGPGAIFEKKTSMMLGPGNMPIVEDQVIKRPLACGCDAPPAGICQVCRSLCCSVHLYGCLDSRCQLTALCPDHYRRLRHHSDRTYCLSHIRRNERKHFLRHLTLRE